MPRTHMDLRDASRDLLAISHDVLGVSHDHDQQVLIPNQHAP
jgi:hypothetical protein